MTGSFSSGADSAAPLGGTDAKTDPPPVAPSIAPSAVGPRSPAAQRALAEAEARRAEIDRKVAQQPQELRGRRGPDPVRYGDWEIKGIACDF